MFTFKKFGKRCVLLENGVAIGNPAYGVACDFILSLVEASTGTTEYDLLVAEDLALQQMQATTSNSSRLSIRA